MWFLILPLHILFADEVNKLFCVKPSALSVQTTSCPAPTIFTYLPVMLFSQETFLPAKTGGVTPMPIKSYNHSGLENCKRAMELAQRHFNIPLVLEPEYLASPHLDELSGMTYLSYFMKVK